MMKQSSRNPRYDRGRAAAARHLIEQLILEIPPTASTARATALQLRQLFYPGEPYRLQVILARIPGSSLAERAERIGTTRQWFHQIWRGQGKPAGKLVTRIAELAGVPEEEVRCAIDS